MKRRTLLTVAAPLLASGRVRAQPRAERITRVIVPYPAGGWADISARIVFNRLAQRTQRVYVIDNRPGAGGQIGNTAASAAAPDGSVLLYATSSLSAAPSLYPRMQFHPSRDLSPVALIARGSLLIVANNDRPERTVADIVTTAKASPGGLDWASGGIGTTPHLTAGLFAHMAGITLNHITYRGGTQALNDVIAGQVGFLFSNTGASFATVQQGQVRAIAHTGRIPVREMPDLPAASVTVPGFVANDWHAVFAPPRASATFCLELNAELMQVLEDPEVLRQLAVPGAEIVRNTPEDLANQLAADTEMWSTAVREAGITPG